MTRRYERFGAKELVAAMILTDPKLLLSYRQLLAHRGHGSQLGLEKTWQGLIRKTNPYVISMSLSASSRAELGRAGGII